MNVSQGYDVQSARGYWNRRVKTLPPLRAVLDQSHPGFRNEAYDRWMRSLITEYLIGSPGLKVLDLGCGIGRLLLPLARKGAFVDGLDISDEMIRICYESLHSEGLLGQASLYVGSANALPCKDESFDVIICVELLFHLPDELRQETIQEIARVLKREGLCIVTLHNDQSWGLRTREGLAVQQGDGYFCEVVNTEFMRGSFARQGLKEIANHAYAFSSLLDSLRLLPKVGRFYSKARARLPIFFKCLYRLSGKLDQHVSADGWLGKRCANLALYVLRKD